MRMKVSAILTGLAVAGLASAALLAASSQARDWGDRSSKMAAQCVTTPIKGTRVIDKRTLIVSDWHGNAAVLTLSGPCLDSYTTGVKMKLVGIRDEICARDDIDYVTDTSMASPGICSVTHVELMSRADAEKRAPGRGVW